MHSQRTLASLCEKSQRITCRSGVDTLHWVSKPWYPSKIKQVLINMIKLYM